MIRKYLKVFATLSIITMLVGCGNAEQTSLTNEIGAVEETLTGNTDIGGEETDEATNSDADTKAENILGAIAESETTESVKNDNSSEEITSSIATTEKVTTSKENTETTSKKQNVTSKEETTTAKKETETTTAKKETETTAHTHSYSSKITKQATCTTTGIKTFTCSCGDLYTEDIAKTGHTTSDWIVTKAATCQSTGTKVKTCTVCNAQLETATIAKSSDHTYAWTHVSNGDYKVNICSGCGAESGTRAYNLGNGIYGYYDDDAAAELFECVNTERNSAHTVIRDETTLEVIGLTKIPSLIWRDEDVAKKRALDIVTKFSHDGYLTDNENLAKGQGTAVDVHCDWCFSSTHRQAMLSIDYVYGSTACLWVDSDGKGTMYPYWTLVLSIQ